MKQKIKDLFSNKTNNLFILLVLSSFILPITYSRYITRQAGISSTALAKWEVFMIEDSNNELELVSKNVTSASYSFQITSTSDVASEYGIKILNVPQDVTLTIDEGTPVSPDNNGEISVENLGFFVLNSINTTHEYTLTFSSDSSTLASINTMELQVDIRQTISN